MVIELLGANLEELKNFCGGKLSVPTVLSLVEQLISRIEFFHAKNLIHRDIKPENFVMGHGETANSVYLIDYGLAKRYRDATTKMHIPYKNNKKLTGTARYASLNNHMGIEQSRRDDLECLAFSLVYLLKGNLPWQGIRIEDKSEKYKKILERKKSISTDMLCKGLPSEFANVFYYCRSLKFEDKPDYAQLRKKFVDLFYAEGHNKKFALDWNILKLDIDSLLERDDGTFEWTEVQEACKQKAQAIAIPTNNVEEEKAKPIVKEAPYLRLSSDPNHLKARFKQETKSPCLVISKRIKEIREEFVAKSNAPKNDEGDDEIPDEGVGASQKHVKECTFIENDLHWKNYRNFRLKPGVNAELNPFMAVSKKRKVSADESMAVKKSRTLPPTSPQDDA